VNVLKVSTKRKQEGENYVDSSTNVSVLQSAIRCISRERHRARGSKRNHGGYGGCISCSCDCCWWNHHSTRTRQSELYESRVKLPTRGVRDRGETSTQTALIVPVILTLLFTSVHFAVFAHASHVTQLAAQRGAQLASTAGGSVNVLNEAKNVSVQTVAELGGNLAQGPQILFTSSLTGMRVETEIQQIVPFLPTHVTRTVWVSNEQFIMEQDR